MKQVHNSVLSEINIYPIKSLKGISLRKAEVEDQGLRYDRRWMLVDADLKCITQREHPMMATITPRIESSGLRIHARALEELLIPLHQDHGDVVMVQVWNNICESVLVGSYADEWFSEALKIQCKLVYMPDRALRQCKPRPDVGDSLVSFADDCPFLIIGQASLDDLNRRLGQPVPMDRFRPNLVISGCPAFAEDDWKQILIGGICLHGVKPCSRCAVTTVDQTKGVRTNSEPLATLATYRLANRRVFFGHYFVSSGHGDVRVGDSVTVIRAKNQESV